LGRSDRAGALDAEGLQRNLSGLMGALEGDVPADIREAFYFAEGEIDTIRVSMGPSRQRQEILNVLEHLEQLIDSSSNSP
jgi:hypothetical protein